MRISKARARLTTSRPILPRPMMPSVLPRSSLPMSFFFSHLPARVEALACGIRRAMASMSASVCSATETALPPGVFMTSTPASVAASRSTLSTPTPARPMTRSLGAFSSTAAFTCTALRTSSASASARCWAYSLGLETMTFQPGWDRNSSIPAAARGSAMRIFIMFRLCLCGLRFDGSVRVNLLNGGHAGSILDGMPVGFENDFQLGDHAKQVREIEIAQVGDAEDLALHGALAVGDNGSEAAAEFLDDNAGIHAGRRLHGGHRGARRTRREQFQTQRLYGGAGGLGQQLSVHDEVRHADLLDVAQRLGHRQNQGSGRRPARFARVAALLFLLQVEVVVRQGGALGEFPGFGADRHEREARRNHEGLLRAADGHVQSPAVDVQGHG